MSTITKLLLATSVTLLTTLPYAHAEIRNAALAVWNTSTSTSIDLDSVPSNRSQLVFVRFADDATASANTNIAIDESHQISLSAGHTSTVMVCPGGHQLSAQSAANKSNDLTVNNQLFRTQGKQTYILKVTTDAQGQATLTPLELDSRIEGLPVISYLSTLPRQTHQISRVRTYCGKQLTGTPQAMSNGNSATTPPASLDDSQTIEFDKPIILDVLFEYDKAVVVPKFYTNVAKMAEFINANNASVIIEGHTDSVGSDEYNLALSKRRAEAVKDLMVSKYGVNADQVETIGYGEAQPIASNDTEAGRQINRRVIATAVR